MFKDLTSIARQVCLCVRVRGSHRDSRAHPAAMGFLFNKCYCCLSSTLLVIMLQKMMLSLREGWEMVYKLHFPLGWVRAVCVRDSCQLSLTNLPLFLPLSHSLFYPFFPSVSPAVFLYLYTYVCVCLCVCANASQGLGCACQFLQQHLSALQ